MDKKQYINEELLKLTQSITSLLLLIGAIITILLSSLDYLVTPENFSKFFFYRLTASFLLLVLFFITKIKKFKPYMNFYSAVSIISAAIPATMIELMIFSFGGHQSPYYAGMIIVFSFIVGFAPTPYRITILLPVIVYGLLYNPYPSV